MEVQQGCNTLNVVEILSALLAESSPISNYRTLRDSLPGRLTILLRCRCVLLYQRDGEMLHFASGTFDDKPGWSAALLAVAHINPIHLNDNIPEAHALSERKTKVWLIRQSHFIAVPLLYHQHAIGVLVAMRSNDTGKQHHPADWAEQDSGTLRAIADVVALQLENTRLLERDQKRILELSLLNSINTQLHGSFYQEERIQAIVLQRTRDITRADLCGLLEPAALTNTLPWVSAPLHTLLFRHFQQKASSLWLVERPGDNYDAEATECLAYLPTQIKTFFAFPLISDTHANRDVGTTLQSMLYDKPQESRVLGIIVGAYHHPRKLQREELLLLQVLASQASTVLENLSLMAEVVEARNEARKLLQQVLEDQRIKEQMEEEQRRLDRLASLGEMAANVAHEVRNPLASIKTSIQVLLDDLTEPDETLSIQSAQKIWIQESVGIVLQEVERLDAIVRDLLLFARPRQLHRIQCNLTTLCEHVLQMLQLHYTQAHITLQRMYTTPVLVWVDMAQIEQVLLNLCLNALHAMPEGGTLTVACYNRTENAYIHQTSQETAMQWGEVALSDTGIGIAPELLERIFQPFFTTKAHGIGLGLAITRRFIEDHRGSIHVESQAGSGSTFHVFLPSLPCEQHMSREEEPASNTRGADDR